jgi:hypothetical protein
LPQLGLSLLITERGTSLYRTVEDPAASKAFAGLDFRSWEMLAARLYSENPFVLKADISRFFYTAYTHSIPWAVLGKEKAKDWHVHNRKKLRAHWSNDFDTVLQSCQSRETFGIPVGPDTSRIIAEILLAGVESDKAFAAAVKGRKAFRLLDDFLIGFDDERAAHKALGALRSALWKFNLQLNEEKTGVARSRTLFREKWKLEFGAIVLASSDPKVQERDIYRLVDLTLHFCSEARTGGPALWACRRLAELPRFPENFAVTLDAFFRLARDFPLCTSHVAAYLINNQSMCREPDIKKRVATWIKATIREHLQHAHDFELSWCLLVAGVLKITIEKGDLDSSTRRPNSVVFATLGMLRERGLLSVSLNHWGWRADFLKRRIYGENWLPFYEAVRRNWTRDKGIISAVTKDPILSKMLAAKVTFLEDQIFDATKINISRRFFRKAVQRQAAQIESAPDLGEGEEDSSEVRVRQGLSVLDFHILGYEG